eukprot:Gb_26068 [translate_table: standard]
MRSLYDDQTCIGCIDLFGNLGGSIERINSCRNGTPGSLTSFVILPLRVRAKKSSMGASESKLNTSQRHEDEVTMVKRPHRRSGSLFGKVENTKNSLCYVLRSPYIRQWAKNSRGKNMVRNYGGEENAWKIWEGRYFRMVAL